ncbi:hypothetical protein [uncultured Desulfovibrio sp.]|uniref:hypothetical protein n=1 Tax=uncultured Desulfovibrio sp. TaxID=167968 RepID=UPI00260AFF8E|nr:hypothetical protein [uncultured Desulfovibrio sp.]
MPLPARIVRSAAGLSAFYKICRNESCGISSFVRGFLSTSGYRRDESHMDTRSRTLGSGSAARCIWRATRAVRILLLFAVLVMLTACGGWRPNASTFGGGSGTKDDPYLIATETHLRNVGINSLYFDGKYLLLTADIALSGPLCPIGADLHGFGGIFDGGGHTISELRMTTKCPEYGGLFGVVNKNGQIRNLTVETSMEEIAGPHQWAARTGAIASFNMGRIENCTSRGLLKNGEIIGGIVGVNKGIVRNCTNDATIEVKKPDGEGGFASGGGIAGASMTEGALLDEVVVSGSLNNGRVTVEGNHTAMAGGIVASCSGSSRIEDCVNEGTVSARARKSAYGESDVYVGGVVGLIAGATAERCVNRGKVRATGHENVYVSGIAGKIRGARLIECRSEDAVRAKGNPGRQGAVVGGKGVENTISNSGKRR